MVVVGIDEVGRGSWAGPLVAAAVVLKTSPVGVHDSKTITPRVREQLAVRITDQSLGIGVGWVAAKRIDSIGLTAAVAEAMQAALEQLCFTFDEIIIDGNYNFLAHIPKTRAIVRADDTVPAVSAASIIAKVARDAYMRQQSEQYPGYGFDHHVGYGTKKHREAIAQYGITPLHRLSYKPVKHLMEERMIISG